VGPAAERLHGPQAPRGTGFTSHIGVPRPAAMSAGRNGREFVKSIGAAVRPAEAVFGWWMPRWKPSSDGGSRLRMVEARWKPSSDGGCQRWKPSSDGGSQPVEAVFGWWKPTVEAVFGWWKPRWKPSSDGGSHGGSRLRMVEATVEAVFGWWKPRRKPSSDGGCQPVERMVEANRWGRPRGLGPRSRVGGVASHGVRRRRPFATGSPRWRNTRAPRGWMLRQRLPRGFSRSVTPIPRGDDYTQGGRPP
jgi:hypothetical protein